MTIQSTISDKEFLDLLNKTGFTPYNFINDWDDIDDYFDDNGIDTDTDPDKYFSEMFGAFQLEYRRDEISEVRIVLYFEELGIYVSADGYHNSYESISEWEDASWYIVEPYQVTVTKYKIKK